MAWRLSNSLNDAVWTALRGRPDRTCRLLAEAAEKIEDAASALGEAAALATVDALRWGKQPRLVQNIGRTLVAKAVPKVGESQTAAVAHCLRIVGIWLCVVRGVGLEDCPCFEAVATEHTEAWIDDELTRQLTGLRSSARSAR